MTTIPVPWFGLPRDADAGDPVVDEQTPGPKLFPGDPSVHHRWDLGRLEGAATRTQTFGTLATWSVPMVQDYYLHPGVVVRDLPVRALINGHAAETGGPQWASERDGSELVRTVEHLRGLGRADGAEALLTHPICEPPTNPWSNYGQLVVWPSRIAGANALVGDLPINVVLTVPASEMQGFAETLRRHYQSEETAQNLEDRDRSVSMPPRTVADANPQLNGWMAEAALTGGRLELNSDTMRRADSGKTDDGGKVQTKQLGEAYKSDPPAESLVNNPAAAQGAAVQNVFAAGQQERKDHPFEKVEVHSDANLSPTAEELDTNALKVAREELERRLQDEYGKALVRWVAAQKENRRPIAWSDWIAGRSDQVRKQREKELQDATADLNGATLALTLATGRNDFNPKFMAGDEAATWDYTRKLGESLKYALQNNLFAADLRQRANDLVNALSDPLGASQILGAMAAGYAIKKGVCQIARSKPTSPVALYASAVLGAGELIVMALKIEAVRKELDAVTFRNEIANAAPHVVALVVEVLQDHVFMNWVRKFTCFVAGTQVVIAVVRDADSPNGMRYVTKNIEDIRIGDVVYARDEFGTALGPQRVTETYRSSVGRLQVLTFADASSRTQMLRATHEHPIWVVNRNEFVPARLLEPGDTVIGPNGERQTLTSNIVEYHSDGVSVYNFTVADRHTYFVSETANDTPLLVHNRCDIKTFRENGLPNGRITGVEAEIRKTDLYDGTGPTDAARKMARGQGIADDDAGHLIAKVLGGRGGKKSGNIVAMDVSLNRGKIARFETRVKNRIEELPDGASATMKVKVEYDGASTRPKRFIYEVTFTDGSRPLMFDITQ